ncbi:hypothetical protein HYPSUDRAFT_199441 [Hypholoma sublateritium FD-334 SS-4]|uniref:Uncharacterized protein n=1 Tax=Hypholoma sublateritium (strain FD-334 SS-4) TaxID=945553 RepID=A0A0D2LE59_HYPSF|nr:hypothetical protein HYPSUDRAFT_199441 [Hypholoma sublateritium FD-334 SS-4]
MVKIKPELPGAHKKQAARPRKKKQVPVQQDKSLWRESIIPEDATINQTDAVKRYRLSKEKELKYLPFGKSIHPVPGKFACGKTYLFSEKQVERCAWIKYGGPEGFERMLEIKEASYNTDNGRRVFLRPTYYPPRRIPRDRTATPPPTAVAVPEPDLTLERQTSTPRLAAIRQEMLGRGEKWLWDAINAAIDRNFNSPWDFELKEPVGAERQPIVEAAVRSLAEYPRRPTSPPPADSQSFDNLQSVLSYAPVHGLETPDRRVSIEYAPGDMTFVSWNLSYTGEVHAALIKIMKEHGLVGWQHARWLVYDKYVACNIGGIVCWRSKSQEWLWCDSARFWLEPSRKDTASASQELASYLSGLETIGALNAEIIIL